LYLKSALRLSVFTLVGSWCRSYSVGKSSALPFRKLSPSDFDPREKVWTRFPPEGSKLTPPHHSADFRWKDYCPSVFRCNIALLVMDFVIWKELQLFTLPDC
jgi:hypothetical protein